MASVSSSQRPSMSEPNNGLDHCSSPSLHQTLPENLQDPLEVEKEPNLESNPVDETKAEMKIETKNPKSRGRMKKKAKRKQPVSETRNKPKTEIQYSTQFQDETKDVFVPSDMVWGKVKNYPWWPGLIFDPVDASELALKHKNKNNLLVAYFYDNTFAWNEASVLKPFRTNFSRMLKQTSTDSFKLAVEEALFEVSRRVGSALSCRCYNGGESKAEPMFVNAGIQANTARSSGDVWFIKSSFNPVEFVSFLSELGQNPFGWFDSLGLVIAKSQLKAFNRARGSSFDLPEYSYTCAFDEENVSPVTSDKTYTRKQPKSVDGDSSEKPILKKHVPEEEGQRKKRLSELFNKEIMRTPKRCKVRVGGPSGSDSFPSGKYKKKRLDSLGDLETKTRSRRKYLRVGQCMRKAANHVTQAKPSPKPNGMTSRKRKCLSMIKDRVERKPLLREKQIAYIEDLSKGKSGKKKKKVLRERKDDEGSFILEDHSSSDMLSQLYQAAQNPLKGYSFIALIDGFFTRFRGYVLNPLPGKRSQRGSVARKLNLMEDEARDSSMSDHIEDDNDNIKLVTFCQKKQKSSKRVKGNILVGNSSVSCANNNGDLVNENKQEHNLGISGTNPIGDLANENKQEPNLVISDANEHEPIADVDVSMPTAFGANPSGDLANENKQEPNLAVSDANEPIPEVDLSMPTAFGANPNGDLANENKQETTLGISDAYVGELPEVDEVMPTALVLNFEETAPLPIKPELMGLFNRDGPLKEAETEVLEKENSAQVVFERHVDAEVAFDNADKLDALRSDLVNFQLSCAPTSNMEPTAAQLELQGGKDAASPVNAAC